MTRHRIKLLLDSGAYSAWKLNESIDLNAYIEFIKRNRHWLENYVNLDVIPGRFGVKRTAEEFRQSAKLSYRNLQRMLDAGLNPIPVFHQGEDFRWLKTLLKEDGHDYVGISTAKDLRWVDQQRWLDEVFSKVPADVSTHGFGITKPAFLLDYPFTTTDSTTWSLSAGYGMIYVPPRGADGKPDYLDVPMRIIMSGVRQANPRSNNRQFEILDDKRQDWIRSFIEDAGVLVRGIPPHFNLGLAVNVPSARRQLILKYYIEVCKRLPLTIFHATRMDATPSELLFKQGMTTQLLSYFELRKKTDEALRSYVETGIIKRKPIKHRRINYTKPRTAEHKARRAISIFKALAQTEEPKD